MSLIKDKVDALFREVLLKDDGHVCENPVTGGRFVKGETDEDSIAYQKLEAEKALLAREWFAIYGPPDAAPLPLTQLDWDDMRHSTGLTVLIGFYARSLAFRDWQIRKHPLFDDFASGLLDLPDFGLHASVARTRGLFKRYPRRALIGMTHGAFWAPHDECVAMEKEYQRAHAPPSAFKKAA